MCIDRGSSKYICCQLHYLAWPLALVHTIETQGAENSQFGEALRVKLVSHLTSKKIPFPD